MDYHRYYKSYLEDNFMFYSITRRTWSCSHESSPEKQLKAQLNFAKKEDFIARIFPDISADLLDLIEERDTVKNLFKKLENLADDSQTFNKDYYSPIVNLGQDISKALDNSRRFGAEHRNREVDWVDCPALIPSSLDIGIPRVGADLGLVVQGEANRNQLQTIANEISEHLKVIEVKSNTITGKRTADGQTLNQKQLVGIYSVRRKPL